jgi:hypothetical protein
MKTFLKILAGLFIFVVAVFSLVLFLTKDMDQVSQDFFNALKNNDYNQAQTYLSNSFKANTPLEELKKFVEINGLNRVKDISWSSREYNGNKGVLKGTLTLDNNDKVPITIELIQNNSDWKIYYIKKDSAGIQKNEKRGETLTKEEVLNLAKKIGNSFFKAMKQKDMVVMKPLFAQVLLNKYSINDINNAFKVSMESKLDWSIFNNQIPKIKSYKLNNNILYLSFYYTILNPPMFFDIQLIKENNKWKIINIDVKQKEIK